MRGLRHQDVRRVCCGQDHTVCLTADGGVFSFGGGGFGQLGHGGKANEVLPRKVMELMGTEVTQVKEFSVLLPDGAFWSFLKSKKNVTLMCGTRQSDDMFYYKRNS